MRTAKASSAEVARLGRVGNIEGDPFVGRDGIEYLHGLAWHDDGAFTFTPLWAHDPRAEKLAFEDLIDLIVERRRTYPGLHVYHYAPYEKTTLGKLMGRYGTREDELDDLLRHDVFVDLYRVVRQGLVIGSPSYSLKKLEPLYMPARTGAITDAGSSIVQYEAWLESGDQQILDDIEAYNRDDVESTWLLRDWLLGVRDGTVAPTPDDVLDQGTGSGGGEPGAPTSGSAATPMGTAQGDAGLGASQDSAADRAASGPPAVSSTTDGPVEAGEGGDPDSARAGSADASGPDRRRIAEEEQSPDDADEEGLLALETQLLDGISEAPEVDAEPERRARWLMAHLLRWHKREDRPEWWRFFERVLDADENDLYDDTEPISGLVPVGEPVPDKQSFIWTYHFDPDQEHKLSVGATVKDPATERRGLEGGPKATTPGSIVALDSAAGTLDLRRAKRSEAPHPTALIPKGPFQTR